MVADNTPTHIESDSTPQGLHRPDVNLFSDDTARELLAIHAEDQARGELKHHNPEAYVHLLSEQAKIKHDENSKEYLRRYLEYEANIPPVYELETSTQVTRFGAVRIDKPEREPIIDLLNKDTFIGRFVLKHIFDYRPKNGQRPIPSVSKMSAREIKRWNSYPNRR